MLAGYYGLRGRMNRRFRSKYGIFSKRLVVKQKEEGSGLTECFKSRKIWFFLR